nr:PhzF family phenazine biosynthesis protein [Streptomyces sp. SID4919]
MSWPDVALVDACVRHDGRGGSPADVTDDDLARRAVAAAAGTSHAAFLVPGAGTPDDGRPVRFFTTIAELSGCGHGTVAAQAVRLTRTALGELNDRHHTGGRTFDTVAIRRPVGIEVWFDQGLVALRHPAPDALGSSVRTVEAWGQRLSSSSRWVRGWSSWSWVSAYLSMSLRAFEATRWRCDEPALPASLAVHTSLPANSVESAPCDRVGWRHRTVGTAGVRLAIAGSSTCRTVLSTPLPTTGQPGTSTSKRATSGRRR